MGRCRHWPTVPDGNTMGKQASEKAERERFLVREFLDYRNISHLPRSIRSVYAAAGPDVRIMCTLGRRKVRIGIEVTEYQSDATDGPSRGRRFDSYFRKIWSHLEPLLAADHQLRECTGYLRFDWTQAPWPNDAGKVAEELVDLLRVHLKRLEGGSCLTFYRTRECFKRLQREPYGDRRSFPLLERYFSSVKLRKSLDLCGPLSWAYNNAACVGLVEEVVVRLIENKAGKLPGYSRTGIDETWLLICAGVGIAHDSAGPASHGCDALRPQLLQDAAAISGFDRVIFWERAHRWHLVLSGEPADEASSGASP